MQTSFVADTLFYIVDMVIKVPPSCNTPHPVSYLILACIYKSTGATRQMMLIHGKKLPPNTTSSTENTTTMQLCTTALSNCMRNGMLQMHPIRTSPYHQQTDSLVERFNRTLKLMLWKAAIEEGKDQDKMLPYLLFAYRDVPHTSTGFSPFELIISLHHTPRQLLFIHVWLIINVMGIPLWVSVSFLYVSSCTNGVRLSAAECI